MGLFHKIAGGLKKTRDALMGSIGDVLQSFTRIDKDLFDELEEILIMGDVGTVTASMLRDRLEQRVKEERVTDPAAVRALLQDIVAELLEGEQALSLRTKPSVILVIGVNGVGKTTTIGKLAHNLKEDGKKVLLAAADTFRDAAIERFRGKWNNDISFKVFPLGGLFVKIPLAIQTPPM